MRRLLPLLVSLAACSSPSADPEPAAARAAGPLTVDSAKPVDLLFETEDGKSVKLHTEPRGAGTSSSP